MITEIIQGHWNELFKREEELSKTRLAICARCPLYKATVVGRVCDPSLYLDPKTNETRTTPAQGYFKGCNCRLEAKSRVPEKHCPANKW